MKKTLDVVTIYDSNHIFFVSDEEIMKDDFYTHSSVDNSGLPYNTLNFCHKPTRKLSEEQYNSVLDRKFNRNTLFVDGMFAKNCKKVVASTDHELWDNVLE